VSRDELVFVPLGGVGEIGMNLGLYGFGQGRDRTWLAVEMGVSFGMEEHLPGVDAILPDITYLEQRRKNLAGIVITHAHEDHFGALFDFWPRLKAPVYMTPFAAGLLAAKRASEPGAPDIPVTIVKQGGRVQVGPFEVEYIPVSHSLPEPSALAIRTTAGLVLHTGDWKLDQRPVVGLPTDEARLVALGEEGVLAVVGDSTNAVREGISPSEAEVALVLEALIAEAPHRVAVTGFASNIARIRSVADAAHKVGRQTVVVGRSMHRAIDVAGELGYLDGLPPFLDQDAYESLPRNRVVALMTGSQGEPRAALARIVSGDHRAVKLDRGDRVIFSSRTIPGNEKAVNAIINGLVDLGAEVLTDRNGLVHVSGHPRREELKLLYRWTRPQILVPVHGEALHLHEHAKLGREIGIPEVAEIRNGQIVRLAPGPAEVIDEVPVGRLFRDGRLIVGAEEGGLRDRRRLGFAGIISVAIVLSDRGLVLEDPQIELTGLPQKDDAGQPLRERIEDVVDETLDSLPKPKRRDAGAVRDAVRKAVRAEIDQAWGKKPTVVVLVTHVED
jgi:ribonuclease J